MRNIFKYVILFCSILLGCYQEENICGREGGEPFYTLPQGNNSYDQSIVDWYERCGFYILYKFDEKDLYWDSENWKEAESTQKLGRKGTPAIPEFVNKQLDLITDIFLNVYSEKVIKEYMPLKILLCSELKDTRLEYVYSNGTTTNVLVYFDALALRGYDYIAINGGNDAIMALSDSMKMEYSLSINSIFLSIYGEKNIDVLFASVPDSFFEVSVYDGKYISKNQLFSRGFLNMNTNTSTQTEEGRKRNDLRAYLELAGYPLDVLEETPGDLGKDSSYPSLRGVLHPLRDVNGLVRQKYEIIIEFLNGLGIDVAKLQHPN